MLAEVSCALGLEEGEVWKV